MALGLRLLLLLATVICTTAVCHRSGYNIHGGRTKCLRAEYNSIVVQFGYRVRGDLLRLRLPVMNGTLQISLLLHHMHIIHGYQLMWLLHYTWPMNGQYGGRGRHSWHRFPHDRVDGTRRRTANRHKDVLPISDHGYRTLAGHIHRRGTGIDRRIRRRPRSRTAKRN